MRTYGKCTLTDGVAEYPPPATRNWVAFFDILLYTVGTTYESKTIWPLCQTETHNKSVICKVT